MDAKSQFVIPGLTKTSRPGYHPQPIYLEKFDPDKRLCVVFYIKEYLARTRDLPGQCSNFFITFSKPHKAATRATLARWIRKQLARCGVDMNVFTSHSTRSTGMINEYYG